MLRGRLLLFALLIVVVLAFVGWRTHGSVTADHTTGSHKSAASIETVHGTSTIPSHVANAPSVVTVSGNDASAAALARGRWSVLKRSPLGRRGNQQVQWDGNELLEVGGVSGVDRPLSATAARAMAAYDPSRGAWKRLASAPSQVGLAYAVSVWTGSELFAFGARTYLDGTTMYAGLYSPATNHWTVTAKLPGRPLSDVGLAAIWTGQQIIVAGVGHGKSPAAGGKLSVFSYDLASGSWTVLPSPSVRQHKSMQAAMVATNEGVLLWSMWGAAKPGSTYGEKHPWGVDVFRLTTDGHWSNVTGTWPQSQQVVAPVFTGSKILLGPGEMWCDYCAIAALPPSGSAVLANPVTLRRTLLARSRLDQYSPEEIWTGRAVVAIDTGGGSGPGVTSGDIAIWNPATNRWTRGPRAPFGPELAVWGGDRLYALGVGGMLLSFAGG